MLKYKIKIFLKLSFLIHNHALTSFRTSLHTHTPPSRGIRADV